MSVWEMIQALARQGHEVSFKKRSDGGYLITKIDGIRYVGATGNKIARSLLGTSLEEALKANKGLAKTLTENIKIVQKKTRLEPIDEEIKKALRKTQRLWRKNNVATEAGMITTKSVRNSIKVYGKKVTLEKLEQAQRYARGIAYTENVKHLRDYILDYANELNNDDLRNLANKIWANRDTIMDKCIYPAYKRLYDLDKVGDDKLAIKQIALEVERTLYL